MSGHFCERRTAETMIQANRLNVFDFDGTLIRVNSFREVNKRLLLKLIRSNRLHYAACLMFWYLIRKSGIISHISFKKKAVAIFESSLSEVEKTQLVQGVYEENLNEHLHAIMRLAENCIVSTSAPYAYMSRLSLGPEVVVISALHPDTSLPDPSNFGIGKVRNIEAFLKGQDVRILNVYTDSVDDQPLIDFAENAYLVGNGTTELYKKRNE